jgi:hypothetical protein
MLKDGKTMNKMSIIEEELINKLFATLKEIPFITPQRQELSGANERGKDVSFSIDLKDGTSRKVFIEIKSNGQPRLIREAINKLYRFRAEFPGSYGVAAAPYISPASAKLCNEEGVGYLDLAGNCKLTFDKIYISREGIKNPFSEKRFLRSLYSPRATRVLRVLLNGPKRAWKIQELAREARVSTGQIVNVKKLLKDREWISPDTSGFSLASPADLLAEWRRNYTFRKNDVRDFYSMTEIPKMESELAAQCSAQKVPFSLTGFSGAARILPGIRYQRIMAYLGSMDRGILDKIGLKEVTSGANVSLFLPYDDGVFYGLKDYDGIPVASSIQVYLDLINYKGRGEEAAQSLYERVLIPSWQ